MRSIHSTINTKPATTQPEKVARYLVRRGPITPLVAQAEFNIWRLAAVIHRLKTSHTHLIPAGYEIAAEIKTAENRTSYTEYRLKKTEEDDGNETPQTPALPKPPQGVRTNTPQHSLA